MFESLVVDTLTRLLGDYVVGLDPDKVKVGVWNGDLQLRGLELRPEALSVLFEAMGVDLPMVVTASCIDLLQISIPWKSLQSKSVMVKLTNTVVVATPLREHGLEAYRYRKLRIKMAQLLADDAVREGNWTEKKNADAEPGAEKSSWTNRLTSKILQKVADNIQIEFTNVIIRYEDDISAPEYPFVMHIKFEELSVKSTDASWEPLFVRDQKAPVGYKMANLSGFQTTLGPLQRRFDAKAPSKRELHVRLLKLSQEPELQATDDRRLLLAPLEAIVRVSQVKYWKITPTELRILRAQRPFVRIEVLFPMVDVMLDQFQCARILQFFNEVCMLTQKGENAFRPVSAKGWWLWALERILPGFNERRRAWRRQLPEHMRRWRLNMQVYISARKTLLACRRAEKTVFPEVIDVLESLEKKLPLEDIKVYRTIADVELENPLEPQTPRSASSRKGLSVFRGILSSSAEVDLASAGTSDGLASKQRSIPGRSTLGLSEVQFLNNVVEQRIAPDRASMRRISSSTDRDSLLSLAALELEAREQPPLPEVVFAIVMLKGSVRLSTGGGTASPLPFLSTNVRELRVGFERNSLSDYFRIDALLASMECWDLQRKMRLTVPRELVEGEQMSLGHELDKSTWYPDEVPTALRSLKRGEKRTETADFAPQHSIAAMRYTQRRAESTSDEKASMTLEAAVAGYDVVLDGTSSCLMSCASFWTLPEEVDELMDALSDATARRLENLRRRLQAVYLKQQEAMSIDIVFQTSRIIVCGASEKEPAATIELGKLKAQSVNENVTGVIDSSELIRYSKYHLSLTDLSVYVTEERLSPSYKEIMRPVQFDLDIDVLQDPDFVAESVCTQSEQRLLPKARVTGAFPSVTVTMGQSSYRDLLRISKSWQLNRLREEGLSATKSYATVVERQMRRKHSRSRSPANELPSLSLNISLKGLTLSLLANESDFMVSEFIGFRIQCEATPNLLRCDLSLKSFDLTSWTDEGKFPELPVVIAFAGPSHDLSEPVAEAGDSFIMIKYSLDYETLVREVSVHCMRLKATCDREVILGAVRYFYGDSADAEVFVDPFLSAGTTALDAALMLKNQAKEMVQLSKVLVQRSGNLRIFAALEGLECTLSSVKHGRMASMEIQGCIARVEWARSSGLTVGGEIDALYLKNLLADRVVVQYLNGSIQERDSWQLHRPNAGGMTTLEGSLRSLTVVHTAMFLSQLTSFSVDLKRDISKITQGTLEIAEVLGDEIEHSKRAIPNFKVVLDFYNVDIFLPRNSSNNEEAVRVRWKRSWVKNHVASEGYNFAFDTGASDVSVSALYAIGEETVDFTQTASMLHITPFVENVDVVMKVDWWRGTLPQESVDVSESGFDEIDPHFRLPAFRLRWSVLDGICLKVCEAQYSVLFFVLNENLTEPTKVSYEQLLHDAEEVARRPPQEQRPRPNETPFVQVLFEVPTFQAWISEGSEAADPRKQLVHSYFDAVTGRINFWSDSRVEGSVAGVLKHVEDCRPDAGRLRKVMRQAHVPDRDVDECFTLTAEQPYLGKLSLALLAPRLTIVVVPELLAKIFNLTVPGYPYLSTTKQGEEAPFTGTDLVFDLPGFEAWLCSEQTPTDQRALVLRGGLNMRSSLPAFSDALRTEITAKEFQMLVVTKGFPCDDNAPDASFAVEVHETPVLFPTNLQVEYESSIVTHTNMLSITADSILSRIAVEDVTLVLAVATRMLRGTNRDDGQPLNGEVRTGNDLGIYVSVQATRILLASEDSNSYKPIVETNLRSSVLRAQLPTVLGFSTELNVNLFDEKKGIWVSGVEPWQLAVNLRQNDGHKAVVVNSDRELSLNLTPVTVKAAFGVARVFRQAVVDIGNCKMDSDHQEDTLCGKSKRPSTAAFSVRNCTGLRMNIWHCNSVSPILLPSDREYEVVLPKDQLFGAGVASVEDMRKEHLRCALVLEGYKPVSVSVAEESIHMIKLEKVAEDGLVQVCPMLWDVSMRDGIPVGTARSLYRMDNLSRKHLEVKVTEREGGKSYRETLEPGGVWHVPISMTDHEFRIRPTHRESCSYDWSKSLLMPGMLASALAESHREEVTSLPDYSATSGAIGRPLGDGNGGALPGTRTSSRSAKHRTVIHCQEKHGKDALHLVLEKVVGYSDDTTAAGFRQQLLDVKVCAPLVLDNLLPRRLHYRLYKYRPATTPMGSFLPDSPRPSQRLCISEGALDPFDSCAIYATEGDLQKLSMCVAFNNSILPGTDSAEGTALPFGSVVRVSDVLDKSANFTIPDNAGRSQVAPLEVELVDGEEGRSLCVFVPFWIYNRSDVDLEFQSWSDRDSPPASLSGSVFLRARPPTEPADRHLGVKGPFASIRRAGAEQSWSQTVDLSTVKDGAVELSIGSSSLILVTQCGAGKLHRSMLAHVVNSMWLENTTDRPFQWCISSAVDLRGFVPSAAVRTIFPGEITPVHSSRSRADTCISFRPARDDGSSDWFWSPAVAVSLHVVVAVKMYNPIAEEQYIALAGRKTLSSPLFKLVIYPQDPERPPFWIQNLCRSRMVAFRQVESKARPWLLHAGRRARYAWDLPFAKDRFLLVQVIEENGGATTSSPDGSRPEEEAPIPASSTPEFKLGIDELQDSTALRPSVPGGDASAGTGRDLFVSVSVRGSSKIVTFSDVYLAPEGKEGDDTGSRSDDVAGGSTATPPEVPTLLWDDFIRGSTSTAHGDASDSRRRDVAASAASQPTTHNVVLSLPKIGVSVVDLRPTEMLYARVTEVFLRLQRAPHSDEGRLDFSLQEVQIDNELPSAMDPVLLWTTADETQQGNGHMVTPLSRTLADEGVGGARLFGDGRVSFERATEQENEEGSTTTTEAHCEAVFHRPFLEFAVRYKLDPLRRRMQVIEGLFLALQKVQLRLDEELVMRLRQFSLTVLDIDEETVAEEAFDRVEQSILEVLQSTEDEDDVASLNRVYIKKLLLCPLQLTISLSGNLWTFVNSSRSQPVASVLARNAMPLLGNIENASFQLKALEVRHAFAPLGVLQNLTFKFYLNQIVEQCYKLLESSSLVSTPAQAFDMIATGVYDFFAEPAKATSSQEFFSEFAKGSASLLENTFCGVVIAIGTIPQVLAIGLDNLNGEDASRQLTTSSAGGGSNISTPGTVKQPAQTPMEGFYRGAESLGNGFTSGIAGLLRDPYQGAIEGGASGFLRGLGTGMIGGVLKPLGGMLDMIVEPTVGLRSMISNRNRFQLGGKWMRPPRVFSRNQLVPYDLHRSIGQILLDSLGIEEQVLGWVSLTEEQPDEARLWDLWAGMREHLRRGEGQEAEPSDPAARSSEQWNRQHPALGVVTASKLTVVRVNGSVVWACPLDNIVDVTPSAEEPEVMFLKVRPMAASQATFLPSVVCGSEASRDLLLELLNVVRQRRNQWQGQMLFGPLVMEGQPSFGRAASTASADVAGIDVFADIMELAENAPLRDPNSRRSVRMVLCNLLDVPLYLTGTVTKSGVWRREAPQCISALSADYCEVDGGSGHTADIHGTLTYQFPARAAPLVSSGDEDTIPIDQDDTDPLGSEQAEAEDLPTFRFSFANLFLARNAYFARGPDGFHIDRQDTDGFEDHALVAFIIRKDT